MRSRTHHQRAVGLIATALAGLFLAVVAGPAWAATAVGQATITQPDAVTPLASGGSQTPFGLLLPDGARCPGDSTSPPFYQEQSYFDPKGTDPATRGFGGIVPDRGYFLVAYGAPFDQVNVQKGTGLVLVAPAFNIARLTAALLLPAGSRSAAWEAGIACVDELHKHVARAWQAEIDVTASASDQQGFVWTAPLQAPEHGGHGPRWAAGAVVLAVAAVTGVGYLWRRRTTHSGSQTARRRKIGVTS